MRDSLLALSILTKNNFARGINFNPFMLDVVFDQNDAASISVMPVFTMDVVVTNGR